MILVDIKNQKTSVRTPFIASDTIQYLEATFSFQGKQWDKAGKIAVFEDETGKAYTFILTDNKILAKDHLDLKTGMWKVGVVGTLEDGTRITTDCASFKVDKACKLDGEVLPPIPPTMAEQILAKAENAEQIAKQALEQAGASQEEIKGLIDEYNKSKQDLLDASKQAVTSANNAKQSETNANDSAVKAKTSEDNAFKSKTDAETAKGLAEDAVTETAKLVELAEGHETRAKQSETNAKTSETNASNSATESKEWADKSQLSAEESARQSERLIVALPKPSQSGEGILTLTDSTDYRVLNSGEKEPLIKGTTKQNPIRHLNGTVISADNVAEGQILPTKVESANKIPYPYVDTTKTENGITYTVNDDGTVTLSGTATGYTSFSYVQKLPIENEVYTLSGLEGVPNMQFSIGVFAGDEMIKSVIGFPSQDVLLDFKTELSKATSITINVKRSSNIETTGVMKVMLNKGKALPYTPYISDFSQSKLNVYGKSLLDIIKIKPMINNASVKVTIDGDSAILINPKGKAIYGFKYSHLLKENLVVGETYTISADSVSWHSKTKGWGWRIEYEDGTYNATSQSLNSTVLIEKPVKALYFYFSFGETSSIENFVLTKPKIEVGSSVTEYEPYKEPVVYPISADGTVAGVQSVSPSMTMLCDKEGLTIDTILTEPAVIGEFQKIGECGKNLFGKDYLTPNADENFVVKNDIPCYTYKDDKVGMKFDFPFKENTQYTFFIAGFRDDNNNPFSFAVNYTDGTSGVVKGNTTVTSDKNKTISNLTSNYVYGTSVYLDLNITQIEVGSSATDYEPYKGSTLTLSQPYKLSKWDSIFRDSDGLWKRKVHRVKRFITQDTKIKKLAEHIFINYNTLLEGCVETPYNDPNVKIYSNLFTRVSNKTSGQTGIGEMVISAVPNNYWVTFGCELNTETEFKNWAIANGAYLLFPLKTPTITPLPQADQDLLNQLVTFYPQTTLTTDEGIILNVKYLADIEHFVERKFNELSQKTDGQFAETNKAIVSLGGI